MARRRARIERAAALHRQAVAAIEAAAEALDSYPPDSAVAHHDAEQHELAARLRTAANALVPGWLGTPLDALPSSSTLPAPGAGTELPRYVRVGVAQPVDDADFPVVVPLLGIGNLAIDADARDQRSAGLLASLLLRLVAATPAGALHIRPVDATGTIFAPFQLLTDAGLMTAPAGDGPGLRNLLTEAEAWVRNPGRQLMVVVIASLPELTDGSDLARLAALARSGPARRLHFIVAGWPPPPLSADAVQDPLAHATQVTLRNPHALVGDPPGASFGAGRALNAPVYLDRCPSAETIEQVCARVAMQVVPSGSTLAGLLPRQLWQESSAGGLEVAVGRTGGTPLSLHMSDLTPHWLVGGDVGAGRKSFLANVLYGLSTRYGPEELVLYLLDFTDTGSDLDERFADCSWMPHVRAAAVRPDREYGLAVLRELNAELARRSGQASTTAASEHTDGGADGDRVREGTAVPAPRHEDAAVTARRAGQHGIAPVAQPARTAQLDRGADLASGAARILCVIEEFDVLVGGTDRIARDALALLDSLARKGRSYGIHLILTATDLSGVEPLYAKRDPIAGQFPVRVALAGGGAVLDPLNQSADSLAPGHAVVNTAGGLGGPPGVSRAHERVVEFPDPFADPALLSALRHRLHIAAPPDLAPPHIFDGGATQQLPDVLPDTGHPTAYLGRVIDVPMSLAAFPLDSDQARHLAILGPSERAADILDAATRSVAAQHPPGSVDFILASFATGRGRVARALDSFLRTAGHRCGMVDAAGFTQAMADPAPRRTYIIGFGLDAAPTGFGAELSRGPDRRFHLLGWWRGLRKFREDGGASIAGLVILNLPAADTALLLDDSDLEWQPRPDRALFHDRDSGRTLLIAPFVHSGQST